MLVSPAAPGDGMLLAGLTGPSIGTFMTRIYRRERLQSRVGTQRAHRVRSGIKIQVQASKSASIGVSQDVLSSPRTKL